MLGRCLVCRDLGASAPSGQKGKNQGPGVTAGTTGSVVGGGASGPSTREDQGRAQPLCQLQVKASASVALALVGTAQRYLRLLEPGMGD